MLPSTKRASRTSIPTSRQAYLPSYSPNSFFCITNIPAQLSQPIQHAIDNNHNHSLSDAVAAGALTRSDFQLLTRNWHDIKRVPIFGLLFAICGEFTPLVVITLSNVVPWTCRIPKQITSDRLTLEKRRSISFRNLTSTKSGNVEELGRMELIHISWSLGLSSSAWDWLGGQLPGLPTGILKGKVRRRVEYLGMDDKLIREEGGVKEMEEEEVRRACVERGIDVCGRSGEHVRESLDAWLRSSVEWPIEKLLLTRYGSLISSSFHSFGKANFTKRPSVWPTKPK